MPVVTTRRIKGVSLEALAERVIGGPSYVRVGLPDSITTDDDKKIRTIQKRGKE